MICLVVQAKADDKCCECTDANHVNADFYPSKKEQQRQKRTHQSAQHKEKQLGNAVNRNAFFEQDKNQHHLDQQRNLALRQIRNYNRINLSQSLEQIIKCHRNQYRNDDDLKKDQIFLSRRKVILIAKKIKQRAKNRNEQRVKKPRESWKDFFQNGLITFFYASLPPEYQAVHGIWQWFGVQSDSLCL